MPVLCWEARERPPRPLRAQRLALVLGDGGADVDAHGPLLRPFVPAVDAVVTTGAPASSLGPEVVQAPRPVTLPDLLAGGGGPLLSRWDRLLWLRPGEVLLTGRDVALPRRLAQAEPAALLLPVHYPWRDGLTLLALEPRLLPAGGAVERYRFALLPVQAAAPPPELTLSPLQSSQAWVALYVGIRQILLGQVGKGVDRLRALARQLQGSPPVTGLVLRNLIAAELGCGYVNRAGQLLAEGRRLHPGYGELQLLGALRWWADGQPGAACAALTELLDAPAAAPAGYMSGGGERTYRLLYHRGRARRDEGNLRGAVGDWGAALRAEPQWRPPLAAVAEQRLHADVCRELQLPRLFATGAPQARQLVLQAYANSSDAEAAPGAERTPAQAAAAPAGVRWEGPLFTDSSLGRVNRELALALLAHGPELRLVPSEPQDYDPGRQRRMAPLLEHLWGGPQHPAVTVSHRYPPAFPQGHRGKWVTFLPWEYGALPRSWVEGCRRVDEVWTYSQAVRAGAIASGLAPEQVQVVPCGFDPDCFHPGVAPAAPVAADFVFLYVGGLIQRKGYDLALQAFLQAFAPGEAVVLLFKAFGTQSFYRGQPGLEQVQQAVAATAAQPRRVLLMEQVLPDAALAGLYRAAQCLVAPYRAEGFGLPILEAMACGVPAIVTGSGPADEFAPPGTALPVAAHTVALGQQVEGWDLVAPGAWAGPDLDDLCRQLRWAYEHRDQLAAIGRRAASHVHSHYTWQHSAAAAAARLQALGVY